MNQYNNTNVDPTKFGGTALAIAYTSDVSALQPNDMTVISVVQQSVWTRAISYDIPADLPACPPGGCLCTWNWIHRAGSGEGYPFEIVCAALDAPDDEGVVADLPVQLAVPLHGVRRQCECWCCTAWSGTQGLYRQPQRLSQGSKDAYGELNISACISE